MIRCQVFSEYLEAGLNLVGYQKKTLDVGQLGEIFKIKELPGNRGKSRQDGRGGVEICNIKVNKDLPYRLL